MYNFISRSVLRLILQYAVQDVVTVHRADFVVICAVHVNYIGVSVMPDREPVQVDCLLLIISEFTWELEPPRRGPPAKRDPACPRVLRDDTEVSIAESFNMGGAPPRKRVLEVEEMLGDGLVVLLLLLRKLIFEQEFKILNFDRQEIQLRLKGIRFRELHLLVIVEVMPQSHQFFKA